MRQKPPTKCRSFPILLMINRPSFGFRIARIPGKPKHLSSAERNSPLWSTLEKLVSRSIGADLAVNLIDTCDDYPAGTIRHQSNATIHILLIFRDRVLYARWYLNGSEQQEKSAYFVKSSTHSTCSSPQKRQKNTASTRSYWKEKNAVEKWVRSPVYVTIMDLTINKVRWGIWLMDIFLALGHFYSCQNNLFSASPRTRYACICRHQYRHSVSTYHHTRTYPRFLDATVD